MTHIYLKLIDCLKYIFLIPQKAYMKIMRRLFLKKFYSISSSSGFGPVGYGDQYIIEGCYAISVGERTWFGKGCEIAAYPWYYRPGSPLLKIGDGVFCTSRCRITCAKDITIGDNVLIAPDVFITDHNHGMDPENPGGTYDSRL